MVWREEVFLPPERRYIMKIIKVDMEIIKVAKKSYELVYEDVNHNGFAFPCDEDGRILPEKTLDPVMARYSLAYCKTCPEKWTRQNGVVRAVISHELYGICPYCGRKVYFDRSSYKGAAKCTCGQWYNWFGQEILAPEEWDDEF